MVYLSKKPIDPKIFQKILDNLILHLARQQKPKQMSDFLENLLTKTERTVLAKRMAVIFLLRLGYSSHYIYKHLNISPSTVARYSHGLESGRFEAIQSYMEKELRLAKRARTRLPGWMLTLQKYYELRPR